MISGISSHVTVWSEMNWTPWFGIRKYEIREHRLNALKITFNKNAIDEKSPYSFGL